MNNTTDNDHDNAHDNKQHADTKSPDRLEREVEEARSQLGRTASELSDRLSPGELMDQALGLAREHGGEFGRNLGQQVKNNPMPMILTSVGLSWMMLSSGNANASHTYRANGQSAGRNGTNVKDALGDAAARSRDQAAAVGDRMQDAGEHMRESTQNAQDSLMQFYREQPLLAGSLGIAIGAALGALVPSTGFENDMLGETSDRSIEAAKTRAASAYDDVRDSARAD